MRKYGGLTPYSYVFNGESGYLDHALATASMAAQVTGVTDWHINPDEPTVLDYNTNFKTANQITTFYDPGPYRASDHDPVVIGIHFNHAPTVDAGGPYTVAEGSSVAVAATGGDADGDALTYAWDLDNDGDFDDATGQTASFSAATIDGPASRTVRVRVSDGKLTTVDSATVNVTNVDPTATFVAPASAFAGFPFTLELANATDAAPADRPGLMYAFDCGSGYGAFSASSTASCPTDNVGTRSVGGKVRDDDGGVTEYRGTVAVVVTFDSLCDLVRVVRRQAGRRGLALRQARRGRGEEGPHGRDRPEVVRQPGRSAVRQVDDGDGSGDADPPRPSSVGQTKGERRGMAMTMSRKVMVVLAALAVAIVAAPGGLAKNEPKVKPPKLTTVKLLAFNDFHGHLEAGTPGTISVGAHEPGDGRSRARERRSRRRRVLRHASEGARLGESRHVRRQRRRPDRRQPAPVGSVPRRADDRVHELRRSRHDRRR